MNPCLSMAMGWTWPSKEDLAGVLKLRWRWTLRGAKPVFTTCKALTHGMNGRT